MSEWNPKEYHNEGKTLEWGKDLTEEQSAAMREGEIFTLLDEKGKPYSIVLMDSYDTIREKPISEKAKQDYKMVTECETANGIT